MNTCIMTHHAYYTGIYIQMSDWFLRSFETVTMSGQPSANKAMAKPYIRLGL